MECKCNFSGLLRVLYLFHHDSKFIIVLDHVMLSYYQTTLTISAVYSTICIYNVDGLLHLLNVPFMNNVSHNTMCFGAVVA